MDFETMDKFDNMRRDAQTKGVAVVSSGLKLIVVAMALIVLFLTSVKIVDVGSVGIKTQFGEAVDVLHPGLHIIVPFVNDVRFISTQIEKYEAKASSASKDLQDVQTQLAVNYQVSINDSQILEIYTRFKGNHESRIIQPLVQEVVKAKTAQFTAEELITKRVEVKTKITDDLETKLANYGLDVAEVSITDFTFSAQFDTAIEAKVVAEQTLQKERIDLQIKQVEVQKSIAVKNATAIGLVIEAEGKAKARLLEADAEAKAIEKVTSAISDPYIKYYYVDQWNGELPKVLGQDGIMIDMGEVTK
jgi:regulator of protease activity HflC (stomatin/prohibitin superfamily)